MSALERVLSAANIDLIRLDSELRIIQATPHLTHLMCPATPLQPEALNGSLLSTHLANMSDVEKFHAFVSTPQMSADGAEDSQGPAPALRINFHHTHGQEISVELFHVVSQSMDDRLQHLLGIREVREEGHAPDESLFQGGKTSFKPSMDSTTLQATAVRSKASKRSSHSSRSSKSEAAVCTKRKLLGLSSIDLKLDALDDAGINEYSLCFTSDTQDSSKSANPAGFAPRPDASGRPSLRSCLIAGGNEDAFLKWFHESRSLLLTYDMDPLVYEHQVFFSHPNAACASSNVVLCAESARLSCSNALDSNDDTLTLEFCSISHVIERHSSVSKRSLPSVSEQDGCFANEPEQDDSFKCIE